MRRTLFSSRSVIHHGARILEGFEELAPLFAIEPSDLASATALLFDEGARRLVIVAPLFASLNAPHHVAKKARSVLPDWTVELDVDLPRSTSGCDRGAWSWRLRRSRRRRERR